MILVVVGRLDVTAATKQDQETCTILISSAFYLHTFDLSVRNSLQPSFLTQAASYPSAASQAGEMEKDERHHFNVSSTGSIFYPLVIETPGLWKLSSARDYST